MTADREAAIRERIGHPMCSTPRVSEGEVVWLLAELAAARERERALREALERLTSSHLAGCICGACAALAAIEEQA